MWVMEDWKDTTLSEVLENVDDNMLNQNINTAHMTLSDKQTEIQGWCKSRQQTQEPATSLISLHDVTSAPQTTEKYI